MTTLTLINLLKEIRQGPDRSAGEEIRLWYGWLFEGTAADIQIPLWESAYKEDPVLLNQVTLQVLECYFQEHLTPADVHLPADDLGLELEFFLILLERQKYDRAAAFFKLHLGVLLKHVLSGIRSVDSCPYYSELARGAEELLQELCCCAEQPGSLAKYRCGLPEKSGFQTISEEQIRERLKRRVVLTAGRGNCGGKCGLEAEVTAGCILDLHGVKQKDPITIPPCARGRAYRQTYLHPGRLRYPMLRTGMRGEGRFRRISWKEAVQLIAQKLTSLTAEYGPGCRYVNYSSGVESQISGDLVMQRLLGKTGGYLGHFNDYSSACITYTLPYLYGTVSTGSSLSSFSDARLAVFWGNNPLVTEYCGEWLRLLQTYQEKKTRVIVIDPHFHETGKMLDAQWIPIRPDTDAALAVSLAYVLWDEELCDQAFMDRYCLGFDAAHMPEGMEQEESFHDYVFGIRDGQPKDPEWAEPITGIPAERIRKLARDLAAADPPAVFAGRGCQRTAGGEQNVRSIAALCCMLGTVGRRGGGTGYNGYLPHPAYPSFPKGDNPYRGMIPAFLWTDAILDGKHMNRKEHHIRGREQLESDIKILFNLAGNTMMNQHSDVNRTARILKDPSKCEFIVVSDLYMTASARYADLLLPGTGMFEDSYLCRPWGQGEYLLYADQVIEPLFESRFEADWIRELGELLGAEGTTEGFQNTGEWYQKLYERAREEEPELPEYEAFQRAGGFRFREHPEHIAFCSEIRDPEHHKFPTKSGKIEIFSPQLHAMKEEEISGIPRYTGGFEGVTDPKKSRYPLQLIGWHTKRRTHSVGDQNPVLEKQEPHRLWIHPEDAAERGIREETMTEVSNDRGRVRIRAHLTREIMPGVVCIPQGAWYTPDQNGTDLRGCVNTLTTSRPTALARANPQHSCLVQVSAAQTGSGDLAAACPESTIRNRNGT